MKKIISYIAAAVLAIGTLFTFVACGEDPVTVTGIEVTKQPTKVAYIEGEKFDPAGMEISKLLSNETKEVLASTEYTFKPDGKLKLSDKKVTVTYKVDDTTSYTADVKITVTNDITEVKVVTEPTKMTYIVGDVFDPAGMTIQATYEDGTESEIVAVNPDDVTYKKTALVASDTPFAMNYMGFDFSLNIQIKTGIKVEAESGLIIAAGASITAGPMKESIEADLIDKYVVNSENTPSVRGIDIGRKKKGEGDNKDREFTIESMRVASQLYIHDRLDEFVTSGGYVNQTFLPYENMIKFDHGKGGQIMYALNGDKAGTVQLILRAANPVPYTSGDAGNVGEHNKFQEDVPVVNETLLSNVFEITVNNVKIDIPATVKFEKVDFTAYKRYVPFGAEGQLITDAEAGTGTYTGEKSIRPDFYWQEIAVDIPVVKGGNNIVIKSVSANNVYLDTVAFDGDQEKISLKSEYEFKPVVKTASLKVEGEKVLMGVVVDAQATGVSDEIALAALGITKINGISNATNNWSIHGGSLDNQEGGGNDPWTNPVENGGLGYTDTSRSYKNSMGYEVSLEKVEKITEGTHAGCFTVWFNVTVPNDKKGPTPETNRYVGAWRLYNFNYGAAYTKSKPELAILKTDDNVTAELGGFCYQVYNDIRDDNNSFNGGELMLIVQDGSFTGDNARKLLGRRYLDYGNFENDPELVELRKPQA